MKCQCIATSNYTIHDAGAKSGIIKTSGYEKMQVNIMLTVLADRMKLTSL
jgi:hypothetical protein